MTKAEKMYALVDQWKKSGKTQKVFCREQDVSISEFIVPFISQREGKVSGHVVPVISLRGDRFARSRDHCASLYR